CRPAAGAGELRQHRVLRARPPGAARSSFAGVCEHEPGCGGAGGAGGDGGVPGAIELGECGGGGVGLGGDWGGCGWVRDGCGVWWLLLLPLYVCACSFVRLLFGSVLEGFGRRSREPCKGARAEGSYSTAKGQSPLSVIPAEAGIQRLGLWA